MSRSKFCQQIMLQKWSIVSIRKITHARWVVEHTDKAVCSVDASQSVDIMFSNTKTSGTCKVRSIIQVLNAHNVSVIYTHHQIGEVYGEYIMSDWMVRRWMRKFNWRSSLGISVSDHFLKKLHINLIVQTSVRLIFISFHNWKLFLLNTNSRMIGCQNNICYH